MPKDLKVILFTCIGFLMTFSFGTKLIETWNVYLALEFMFQVILILIGMVATGAFFLWLGLRIFHD